MSGSDAVLIARVLAGADRSAFALLVQRHQSPMRQFLRRLTRHDLARADDLAQETFLRMSRSLGTFRGQSKFSSWLYRIAYNTFLDDQRSRVSELSFDEAMHAPAIDPTPSVNDMMDVEQALRLLSDRQRAVFDLHYRLGMAHHEVAAALEVPLGTVKSDLSRGLDHLRAHLTIPERR